MFTHKNREQQKQVRQKAGMYLRDLRQKAGLTQKELAEKAGFGYYTFIGQLEGGSAKLPSDSLAKYAKAVGVDVTEFTQKLLQFYDPDVFWLAIGKPFKEGRYVEVKPGQEIRNREPAVVEDLH